MKSYTNLEQSQKLAEILPVKSADMFLALNGTQPVMSKYIDGGFVTADNTAIPCWSLAALLNYLREIDVFPEIEADKSGVVMNISFYDVEDESRLVPIRSIEAKTEDFIDTCYEMILKLKEKDLL